MSNLLDSEGRLIWRDLACTVPAYRGPIPEMEGPSEAALSLRNDELAANGAAAFFM